MTAMRQAVYDVRRAALLAGRPSPRSMPTGWAFRESAWGESFPHSRPRLTRPSRRAPSCLPAAIFRRSSGTCRKARHSGKIWIESGRT